MRDLDKKKAYMREYAVRHRTALLKYYNGESEGDV